MEETRLATAMVAQMGLDYSDVEKSSKNAAKVFSDLKADIERIGASMDAATAKGADLETVSKNVAKAGGMIASAWETAEQVNGRVNASVKRLKDEYSALGKTANEAMQKGTEEGDVQMRAAQSRMQAIKQEIAQYNAVQRGMEEVTGELSKQETEYNRIKQKIDNATEATVSMRQQLRQVTEQMYAMRAAALESGGQAAVKAVMASDAYQELAEKAASLRDIQSDVNAEMTTMANDNGTLKAVITGVQGVAGAFGVAQGAIGLFAGESEDLQKVMTKVQSLMAVMMGLQQVVNTLNKDSALMTSLRRWAVGFQATGTAATGAAAKIKLLWAAMKANPAGLIIAALTAVAGVIGHLVKKSREAREEAEKARKVQQEYNESIAQGASSAVTELLRLGKEWKSLGRDMSAKKKFIEDNQAAFRQLGLSVASVTDAENVFKKNTQSVIDAMRMRSEANVILKQSEDKVAQKLALESQMEKINNKILAMVKSGQALQSRPLKEEYDALKAQADTIERQIDNSLKRVMRKETEAAAKLKDAGISTDTTKPTTPTTPKKDTSTDDYISAMEKKMDEWSKLLEKGRKQREKEAEEQRKNEERVFAENRSFTDRRLDLDREYAAARSVITAAQIQDEEVRTRTLEQLRRNYIDAQKRLQQEELDDIREQTEEKYRARMDAAEAIADEQERENAVREVNLDILKDEKAALEALVAIGRRDLLPALQRVNAQIQQAETNTESWQDKVKSLLSYYEQIEEYIGKVIDGLYETGDIAEGSKLEEWLSGLSNGINTVVKGFLQGGVIGAFAGAALSAWQSLAKHVAKVNKELDDAVAKTKEAMELRQKAKQDADANAVFGYDNGFADMNRRLEALKAYGQIMQAMQQAFNLDPTNKLYEQQKLFWEEQYLQQFSGIEEAYSSIFNNISNDIMDAMMSAADNTDEAFSSLTDNIAGYVRQWVTNMLYADRVSAKMAENRERMNKAFATGDQETINQAIKDSIADLYAFAQQLKAEKAVLESAVDSIYKEIGIDTATGSSRTGAVKGIAQSSQESVSELNGRMTAVQAYTFRLAENSDIITGNVAAILGSVRNIDRSTSVTMEHVRYMRTSLDDIVTNGVKMRN